VFIVLQFYSICYSGKCLHSLVYRHKLVNFSVVKVLLLIYNTSIFLKQQKVIEWDILSKLYIYLKNRFIEKLPRVIF